MEERSVKQFKKLVGDFRVLTTKVQKDNQIKSKNLKETNQVIEACKKEYQKLYLEHEQQDSEQQDELHQYQNHLKN